MGTRGRVEVGGKIIIIMPDTSRQAHFEFAANPAITFTAPAGITGTAAWTTGTRTLVITTTNTGVIGQDTAVTFTIADTTTPTGTVDALNAEIDTVDSQGQATDGTTAADMSTEATTTGTQTALTFTSGTSAYPGYLGTSTIQFTTKGALLIGAKVEIVFPDQSRQHGWNFDAAPAITFSAPGGVGGDAQWTAGNRKLVITTKDAIIPQSSTVTFTIANTITPSGTVDASTAAITIYDSGDVIKSGPNNAATTSLTCPYVATNSGSGTRAFTIATTNPGFKSLATVKFKTAGIIYVGGKIVLKMPSYTYAQGNYDMDANPAIVITEPTGKTATSAWDYSNRILTVTMGGTAGATGIAQTTDVTFTIANVKTPTSTVGSSSYSAFLKYTDSGDKLTAGNPTLGNGNYVTTPQTTAGTSTPGAFVTAIDTPGRKSISTVTFTTKGEVKVGGKFRLTMPSVYAQYGWRFENAAPPVTVVSPTADTWTVTPVWSSNNRRLELTVAGNAVPEASAVQFTIANTMTPSSI